MNSSSGIPLWFPFVFVIVWLFVTGLLAFASGWRFLAAHHRANGTTIGRTFYFVSASIGDSWFPVRYRNCLTFAVSEQGFFVEPILILRFLSPRLFIPWSAVEIVDIASYWFVASFRVKLIGTGVTFYISGSTGKSILDAWTANRSSFEMQRVS